MENVNLILRPTSRKRKRGFAGENQPEAKKAYFNLCLKQMLEELLEARNGRAHG